MGNTPLLWAAYFGSADIARHLIQVGADVDVVNAEGKTGIQIAAERGHSDVRLALIAAGAKLYRE